MLKVAKNIIDTLNSAFPDVPFHQGDIRKLPYTDKTFDGLISLGVIEHFLDGQDQMLREAARVIKPGGHIFVSVPALNGYRKWKIKHGLYAKSATKPFFESCISVEELDSLLMSSGFSPVEHCYMNTVMTFAQETPLRPLYWHIEDVRYVRGIIDRILNLLIPKKIFGHMVMVVAKRND
jgi:ubiquinone/menaquinone biosynthesis C-methylase UbiE